MAIIKREEGFKLPKEPITWASFNNKVIIKKLMENHFSYLKKEKQQKQNQPQPKLKLNPKKERRLIKK